MLKHGVAAPALLAGVLASTSVVVAAPASARDTWTTTTIAVPDYPDPESTVLDFGQTFDVEVDVDSQGGSSPTRGTSTLYAMEARTDEWVPVATSTSSSGPSGDFLDVRPRMTTSYKVVYNGHRASSSQGDSFEPSDSDVFTVEVARTITHPAGGFTLEGRVRPRYRNKVIVVQVSRTQGSGYTRWKAIRTDRRGRYGITLPRRRGTWYWFVKVRGDDRYLPTGYEWETWVSEPSPRTIPGPV